MNSVTSIVISFFLIFIFFAFIAVRLPKKRDPCENGLTPEFEEICGGRINFINYTWPFLRHSIYKDFIVIKSLFGTYILPRISLSKEGVDGVFSQGVRYASSKYVGYEFRIWTFNKNKVMEIFKNKA